LTDCLFGCPRAGRPVLIAGRPFVSDKELQPMRKIKLSPESLTVQSFATSVVSASRGTVVAHDPTLHGQQCGSAFDACHTGLCTPNC
jgi:hypothetical protein